MKRDSAPEASGLPVPRPLPPDVDVRMDRGRLLEVVVPPGYDADAVRAVLGRLDAREPAE